jgi:hypothetical protein
MRPENRRMKGWPSCSGWLDLFASRFCGFQPQFQTLFPAFALSVYLFCPIDLFVSAHKISSSFPIKTGFSCSSPGFNQARLSCLHQQKAE